MDLLQSELERAYRELNEQVDAYVLSFFGGSVEKFKELAPLYILEERRVEPEFPTLFGHEYSITLTRDIRLRPKRFNE